MKIQIIIIIFKIIKMMIIIVKKIKIIIIIFKKIKYIMKFGINMKENLKKGNSKVLEAFILEKIKLIELWELFLKES